MGVLKSILLIVYLVPFGANAQFRIVGLLNVDDPKTDGNKVSVYQSNAQGRGFSVDDGLKKFLIRPKNIIRVRIIDDIHQSVLIPETDNILMIRKQKPTVQRPTESFRHETIAVKKKPLKPGKDFEVIPMIRGAILRIAIKDVFTSFCENWISPFCYLFFLSS